MGLCGVLRARTLRGAAILLATIFVLRRRSRNRRQGCWRYTRRYLLCRWRPTVGDFPILHFRLDFENLFIRQRKQIVHRAFAIPARYGRHSREIHTLTFLVFLTSVQTSESTEIQTLRVA